MSKSYRCEECVPVAPDGTIIGTIKHAPYSDWCVQCNKHGRGYLYDDNKANPEYVGRLTLANLNNDKLSDAQFRDLLRTAIK